MCIAFAYPPPLFFSVLGVYDPSHANAPRPAASPLDHANNDPNECTLLRRAGPFRPFQPRFVQFWIPFPRGKSNRSRVKELVQGYQWVSLKKSFQSFNSRFKRCDTIRNRSINLSRGQDFGMVTRHSSRVQPIFRGSTSFPYTLDHALLPLRLCKARGGGWGWMHAVDHVATFFFSPPTARKFPRNTLVTHAMYLSSSRDNDFLHVFPTREQAQG